MSCSKVWEHLGFIADVKAELTTLGAFLRTVWEEVVNRLALDYITRVCCNDSVPYRVFQGIVRKWLDIYTFRSLRRMHSIPLLALLAIAWLVEMNWDATAAEWFSFGYEQSKFIFILLVPVVTRIRADETKIIKSDQDDIRPIYLQKLAGRGMSRDFAVWAGHVIHE